MSTTAWTQLTATQLPQAGTVIGFRPAAEETLSREHVWNAHVQRIAAGEDDALADLYDQTGRLVYSLALRILGQVADAEEVTVDVYTQVWRSSKNFDSRRGTAAAWLTMLTRSRAIDRLRSRKARGQREEPLGSVHHLPSPAESPEVAFAVNQEQQRVRKALQVLTPEQRQAIELAFFSGLSHSQVAAQLGQPLGTVKTRIRTGMIKLREQLAS